MFCFLLREDNKIQKKADPVTLRDRSFVLLFIILNMFAWFLSIKSFKIPCSLVFLSVLLIIFLIHKYLKQEMKLF